MNSHQSPAPQADGFRVSLQSLTPADLQFITPASSAAAAQATAPGPAPKHAMAPKTRRRSRGARQVSAAPAQVPDVPAPSVAEPTAGEPMTTTPPGETTTTEPVPEAAGQAGVAVVDNAVQPGDATAPPRPTSPGNMNSAGNDDPGSVPNRKRRHVERAWPEVGTILTAEYYGQTYRAEIISATKRLKSGKQIRLLDGTTRGRRFNSFSGAMLAATARQRKAMKLKRKGAANGWDFWAADPVASADPADSASVPITHPVPGAAMVITPAATAAAS